MTLHTVTPRARICPRSGVRTFRPRRRAPALTRLGWALLFVLALLLGGVGAAVVRADDEEPVAERYTPSARGTRAAVTQWRPLLEGYSDWHIETALRVLDCESGGDPEAINPSSGAAGLMQLYGWAWLARRLFGTGNVLIPEVNIGVAHVLWLDSGGTFAWHWAASAACWR